MKKLIGLLVVLVIILGCNNGEIPEEKKTDPCSTLVNGVYQYPTKKPDPALTKEETKEYWNIPKEVLGCLTTGGLIKSCYMTIYGILISASNGYQSGYKLLKGWCRGFDELEKRPDAPAALILYYKSIELPNTIDYNLFGIEVANSQDSILKHYTKEQKIEMLNLSIKYHTERREIFNRPSIIYDGTVIFMGRLLVYDKNKQFLLSMERNDQLVRFIDGTGTYQLSIEYADTIMHYTETYLNQLIAK